MSSYEIDSKLHKNYNHYKSYTDNNISVPNYDKYLSQSFSKGNLKEDLLHIDAELTRLRKKIDLCTNESMTNTKLNNEVTKSNFCHYNEQRPKIMKQHQRNKYLNYSDCNGYNNYSKLNETSKEEYEKGKTNICLNCKKMEAEVKEKNIIIQNLMKEIKNMKHVIIENESMIQKLKNVISFEDSDKKKLEKDLSDYSKQIEELKMENEKLKEENEKLKSDNVNMYHYIANNNESNPNAVNSNSELSNKIIFETPSETPKEHLEINSIMSIPNDAQTPNFSKEKNEERIKNRYQDDKLNEYSQSIEILHNNDININSKDNELEEKNNLDELVNTFGSNQKMMKNLNMPLQRNILKPNKNQNSINNSNNKKKNPQNSKEYEEDKEKPTINKNKSSEIIKEKEDNEGNKNKLSDNRSKSKDNIDPKMNNLFKEKSENNNTRNNSVKHRNDNNPYKRIGKKPISFPSSGHKIDSFLNIRKDEEDSFKDYKELKENSQRKKNYSMDNISQLINRAKKEESGSDKNSISSGKVEINYEYEDNCNNFIKNEKEKTKTCIKKLFENEKRPSISLKNDYNKKKELFENKFNKTGNTNLSHELRNRILSLNCSQMNQNPLAATYSVKKNEKSEIINDLMSQIEDLSAEIKNNKIAISKSKERLKKLKKAKSERNMFNNKEKSIDRSIYMANNKDIFFNSFKKDE